MRQELLLFLAGLALVAAGCGLTSSVDEIPLNEAELGEGVLEAVNALVPTGSPMVFEEILVEDDGKVVLGIAPDLWRIATDAVGVDITPIPGGGTEMGTVMKLEAICIGFCGRQDWSDYMYYDEFSPFVVDREATVLLDEPLSDPEGRSLVAEPADGGRLVLVGRWNDGATHFFLCRVKIDPADVALEPAFTAACEGSVPLWVGR
jgi:hypothetical protein